MHPDSPMFVTVYSYKGGSGRTTTGVNVGSALMAQGHHVVVLDADLGAGGLRTVCRNMGMSASLDDAVQRTAGVHEFLSWWVECGQHVPVDSTRSYAQRFFPAFDFWGTQAGGGVVAADESESIEEGGISVAARSAACTSSFSGLRTFRDIAARVRGSDPPPSLEGELLIIPGSLGRSFLSADESAAVGLGEGLKALGEMGLSYLRGRSAHRRKKGSVESGRRFVIIDAASGLTANSFPALLAADVVVQFFRFSSQHHDGTKDNIKKLIGYLHDERRRAGYHKDQRVLAAGTCLPLDSEREWLSRLGGSSTRAGASGVPVFGAVADMLLGIEGFWDYVKSTGLASRFGRRIEYVGAFPEHPLLRHREDVALFCHVPDDASATEDQHYCDFLTAHEQYIKQSLDVADRISTLHSAGDWR